MRFGPSMAVLGVVLSLSASSALAAVCLEKSMSLDEIVDTINATSGCERAMKVFEDCELSSSGDIRLGAAVEKKCERDFLGRLRAPQKQAYQRRHCSPAPFWHHERSEGAASSGAIGGTARADPLLSASLRCARGRAG